MDYLIDHYYHIYMKGKSFIAINEYYNVILYTPPRDIDYLDFSLLVDFTTKCILIKKGILDEDKNIDVSTMPKMHIKFIDYIIDVYKKCSNRSSYINIDKAITFWNIYCIMKIVMYVSPRYNWIISLKYLPPYLTNAIFDYGNFYVDINDNRYSIYIDFIIGTVYTYIFVTCAKYDSSFKLANGRLHLALCNIQLYPMSLCIKLLDVLPKIYKTIENEKIWDTAFQFVINNIKGYTYYPKNHPLINMMDCKLTGTNKLKLFRSYFKLIHIQL